jgi:hypothetical protein
MVGCPWARRPNLVLRYLNKKQILRLSFRKRSEVFLLLILTLAVLAVSMECEQEFWKEEGNDELREFPHVVRFWLLKLWSTL